jgi:hypothetical protein
MELIFNDIADYFDSIIWTSSLLININMAMIVKEYEVNLLYSKYSIDKIDK